LIVMNILIYKRIKQFEQTLASDALRVCFTRGATVSGGSAGAFDLSHRRVNSSSSTSARSRQMREQRQQQQQQQQQQQHLRRISSATTASHKPRENM
jgi:cyanophycinase-like exopeptidase